MTDRPAVEPEVERRLGAAARAYELPAGDVDAVLRRGRRRATSRHRALAAVSIAALVGATLAGVDRLGGDAETNVASGTGVVRGEVGVVWRQVSPASGLGYSSAADANAPLYALSTAPGQADLRAGAVPPRVVWRSEDGVEWTALSALDQDLFLSDLSADGDRVYAVGTGPATAAVGARRPVSPLLVGWSDDGARTWQRTRLPLDLDAIAARSLRSGVVDTEVAAGPHGTVVVGVLDAALDVTAALPAGATAPHGWSSTAAGVDLLGPDRGPVCPEGTSPPKDDGPAPDVGQAPGEAQPLWCMRDDDERPVMVTPQDARGVTASYSWAELGVDGDLLRAVRRQPVAYFAPPGSDRFERVELPALASVQGTVLLDASDAGFDLVTTTTDGSLRGDSTGTVAILTSADGRSWGASQAAPAGGQLWAAAAGRVGSVVTIVAQRDSGAVVLRADGAGGWTTTSLTDAVDPDARGDRPVHVMSAGIGPFGVVAAVAVESRREGPVEQRVVVSRDGLVWDDAAVAELAGRPVRNVIRAAVVGERATVAVSVVAPDGDRPLQVVLVGTPD